MPPIAVLAHSCDLRDLLLRSLPTTSLMVFTDEVFPGAPRDGAVLVVDAEQGFDPRARLSLRNARRCGISRLALLLVHRAELTDDVLALAESEARGALSGEGFDGTNAPLARASYQGVGIYARLASLDELFAALAAWPPAIAPAAASNHHDVIDPLLDALWSCAHPSTLLAATSATSATEAALLTADTIVDLAPVPSCCDAPRLRRMIIDLRAMHPAAPDALGAFAVYTCHRHHQCSTTRGDYLIRHIPRADLPPSTFAAITYPFSFAAPRPPTVLVVDHPRWMCANPESLDDYWSPDPRGAALASALRPWMQLIAGTPLPTFPDPIDEDLALGESLEAVLDSLALDVPIEERSGGPLLVQSGGWIPRCALCSREEHVVFQTQAFTGDNTTILLACPAHPDTASVVVMRL